MKEPMAKMLKVKPAPGKLIRYPEDPKKVLPSEGGEVPRSTYWLRRLMVGDVLMVAESKPAPQPKKEPKAKASEKQEG